LKHVSYYKQTQYYHHNAIIEYTKKYIVVQIKPSAENGCDYESPKNIQ